MFQVVINGKQYEVNEDLTILQVLHSLGIQVPTLCHDNRLKPIGGCRLCVVNINGFSRPATSCNTKIADGMVIETHSQDLEKHRKVLLRLLSDSYVSTGSGNKEFDRLLKEYEISASSSQTENSPLVDDSHPYISVNMSKCVTCFRCVRICEEIQGQFIWKAVNRGYRTKIVPDLGMTLKESECVSCGACADTCPTGALEDKTVLQFGAATEWTKTTCPYCGTGCEMLVGKKDDRIVKIKPDLNSPVNKGHLCVKGRYSFDFVYAKDRVTEPMIRTAGKWKTVSWGEVIAFVSDSLTKIVAKYGPDSVGVLGSSRGTNEENYLAQKFARIVLGTNNIDCCARVCHAPTATAMKETLGTGAATNSFDDIENAGTIAICGANPTENHPVVGARIKQAVLNGANLIVIDPRKIELAKYSKFHLQLKPGTNVPLLNALACAIVEEGLVDQIFISQRVDGFESYKKFILSWTPERVSKICGVDPVLIKKAAIIYATVKPSMFFHGLGMTEHTQGTESIMCLVNLGLITGNIGKIGSGVNPLRGQNNVQGSAHMGCEPHNLTGYVPIEKAYDLFKQVWGSDLPRGEGLNMLQMMDSAKNNKLKALWAIGYDIFLTNSNASFTKKAIQSLELLIVQDLFLNKTAGELGHVFLPAASSFEKEGTFMNSERRVQRVRKVIDPVGHSKSDWEIVCLVAKAMGKESCFDYKSSKEIWEEVRKVWKAGSGITYDRIEKNGLQWPCPAEDHPGTQILHVESFPIGSKAFVKTIEFNETKEITSSEYPFLLVTGRTLFHFNAGTMTMRSANVNLLDNDYLDISPQDAALLGLRNKEKVKIVSKYGHAVLPVRIHDSVKKGELFTTFHMPDNFVNFVTGPYRDNLASTPEYKITAVKIEKLS
ncbi:MAG: formate dehydrogenase subunit alpha [Planctomycetes bacterium]|nr:formate dehydrogenase subunit alpha [Planctomycetota bacterium]